MKTMGKRIILASNSPRRKELLAGIDIDFEIDTRNNFKEEYPQELKNEAIPEFLSEGKSYGFHRELEDGEILITSDTLVICDNLVMGKPESRTEAFQMLKALSGGAHKVITAITFRTSSRCRTVSDTATVYFKHLTDDEITYYLDTYMPYDKAGAYGIQEWIGYIGITRIEGSFFTIMGLPVHLVYELLREFGA